MRPALALLAVELGALWAMGWIPGAAGLPCPAAALWAVAFTAYAFAASRSELPTRRQIWIGGIVARAGLLPLAPALSEDVYRYVWDGWVQRNGTNPFAYPPAADELAGLRTEWWSHINHAEVPTIYPPGAQVVFAALVWIGPAWWIFKLAWLAADLTVARLVERLSRGSDRRPLLLYLWSPLLLVEVAWSAHLEPLGIAFMLGAVLAMGAGAAWRTGALLGLGAAVKFAPWVGLPILWRRLGWKAALAGLAVPLTLYLPYASAGSGLFGGLGTYADIWEFNAGAFELLDRVPGPTQLPKWVAAAGVLGIVGTATRRSWSLERTLFWAIGAALVLSPTIHPWYVLWVLPFACIRGSRGWLLLTGTVFLAYAGRDVYLATGTWPEPGWLKWLIHAPPLACLAWDAWRDRSQRLGRGREVAERE